MDALDQLIEQPLLLPLSFGLLGILLAALLFWKYLARTRQRRAVERVLKQLGNRYIKDLVIPDGIGGEIQLDYLVATEQGLLVLDVSDITGIIFAGEKLEQWVYRSEMKSYRFPNPMQNSADRCASVRELVKEVPVLGRIAFHHGTSFPKGKPEGIVLLDELAETTTQNQTAKKPLPGEIDRAWQTMEQFVSSSAKSH